jgi:hypothetical protein
MPYLGVELIPMLDIVPNVLVPDEAFTLSFLCHIAVVAPIIDPLAVCIDILVTGPPSCILLSPQPHPEDLLAIIVPPAFLVAIDEVWITLLLLEFIEASIIFCCIALPIVSLPIGLELFSLPFSKLVFRSSERS